MSKERLLGKGKSLFRFLLVSVLVFAIIVFQASCSANDTANSNANTTTINITGQNSDGNDLNIDVSSSPELVQVSPEEKALAFKEEARRILGREKRFGISKARNKFINAQSLTPNDPQIAYYLAWLDDLNYSLKDEPGYQPYGNVEPTCQSASERYRKAITLFDRNRPTDSISQEMVVEIGHYLSNRDQAHRKAIELYNKHILTTGFDLSEPVTYMALISRGMAYFWLGEYGNAEVDFEQALAQKPSNQVAYNRGSVYAVSGVSNSFNYDRAIDWYKAAINGGKATLSTSNYLGRAVQLSGEVELDEAWRDYGFVLLLNLKQNETSEQRIKHYEEARQKFEQAIRLNKDGYLAYVGKGVAQYFEGNTDDSVFTLNQVPDNSPYAGIAKRYLQKIEQCQLEGYECVNHFAEIEDLSNLSIMSILTSKGIARVFGNVVVHDDPGLDEILALEHAALYKGPCPD